MADVWTQERIDQLCALYANGTTLADIAREMGIGKNSVIGKAFRLRAAGVLPEIVSRPRPQMARPAREKVSRVIAEKPRKAPVPIVYVPPRKTASALVEIVAIPRSRRVVITDLGARSCRFPVGDPQMEGFGFCGERTPTIGLPYCAAHMAVCYVPVKKLPAGKRKLLPA